MSESPRWPLQLGLTITWGVIAGLVALTSLPDSPLRTTGSGRRIIGALLPQGWAFFTRDPREPAEVVYRVTPNGLRRADFTNSSPDNWMGIRKNTRPIAIELGALLSHVHRTRWRACRGDLGQCLKAADSVVAIADNASTTRRFCGDFVVERRPTVPWAWSRSGDAIRMPAQYVRLQARCR
jgi:antimicrobial peptide system SdpA family protein